MLIASKTKNIEVALKLVPEINEIKIELAFWLDEDMYKTIILSEDLEEFEENLHLLVNYLRPKFGQNPMHRDSLDLIFIDEE